MMLDEYQHLAARTDTNTDRCQSQWDHLVHAVLGICSEAGEIAGHLQKYYQGHDIDQAALEKELGDALWFLSKAARRLGKPLSVVAAANIAKLKKRFPPEEGFSVERSVNRVEE